MCSLETHKNQYYFHVGSQSGFSKAQMAGLPKYHGNSLMALYDFENLQLCNKKRPESNLKALILVPFLHSQQSMQLFKEDIYLLQYVQVIKIHSLSSEQKGLKDLCYFTHRNRLARETASKGE